MSVKEDYNDGEILIGQGDGGFPLFVADDTPTPSNDSQPGTQSGPATPPDGQNAQSVTPTTITTAQGQSVEVQTHQVNVDLVLAIDVTGSMEPFLNTIKKAAINMPEQVAKALEGKQRLINRFRVRVISFRDYYFDYVDPAHPPMVQSDFFTLPDEQAEFAAFVNALTPHGGEDEPESALEALHLSFHSDWQNDPTIGKNRQIIMLFTDASAHPLDDPMRSNPEFNIAYPQDMPHNLDELQLEFDDPNLFPPDGTGIVTGRRLILFAPEHMYPWKDMAKNNKTAWSCTECRSMDPEKGLEGLDIGDVLKFIAGSLT